MKNRMGIFRIAGFMFFSLFFTFSDITKLAFANSSMAEVEQYQEASKDDDLDALKNYYENGRITYDQMVGEMYNDAIKNGYSQGVVDQLIEEGYLAPYEEELIAAGKASSSHSNDSSSNETPQVNNTEQNTDTPQEPVAPSLPSFTVEDFSATMYVVGTDTLNVRDGAASAYNAIGSLPNGAEVFVTGKASTGWYRIVFNDGVGYCSSKYLAEKVETKTEVTENTVHTSTPEQGAELPQLPLTHDFATLDMSTNIEFSKFLGDNVDGDDYINIPYDAPEKDLYEIILNLTTQNGVSATINFVNENKEIVYAYTFTDCFTESGVENKCYPLGITFENETLTLSDALNVTGENGNISLTLKVPKTGTKYTVSSQSEVLREEYSDSNGYITFELNGNPVYTVMEKAPEVVTEEVPATTEIPVEWESPVEEQPNNSLIYGIVILAILVIVVVIIVVYKTRKKK